MARFASSWQGRAFYGSDENERIHCKASATVRASAEGWFEGEADPSPDIAHGVGSKKPRINIRPQGQTLRVGAGDEMEPQIRGDIICNCPNQLSGNYFPAGKTDSGTGAAAFVAPTFDCARPGTASDEEICADPELAANDVRLDRASEALLPRLDGVTRRWLTEDQCLWVKTQAQR